MAAKVYNHDSNIDVDFNNVVNADDDDDDDDEFFGNQNGDDDIDDMGEFGAMHQYEQRSRAKELETIGYLESFDATKDGKLQEGFEAGYRETYDAAFRIGVLLGEQSAKSHGLLSNNNQASIGSTPSGRHLVEFLQEFENRPTNDKSLQETRQALEKLESELKSVEN